MWTAVFRYSCRKIKEAVQDRAGWIQVACDLRSTRSDEAYVKATSPCSNVATCNSKYVSFFLDH